MGRIPVSASEGDLLLMGAFFLLFGFTSVNLFVVLKANIELLSSTAPW
jgi:hypothetical protein